MNASKTSWSEISTYRMCPHKHRLAYKEGWQPSKLSRPLEIGLLWHELLELHYGGLRDEGAPRIEQIISLLNQHGAKDEDHPKHELGELVLWMYHGYRDWAKLHDREWKVHEVEFEFEVPLPGTETRLCGRIDLVIEFKRHLFVVDHKCLFADTLIPTLRGLIPIGDVTTTDLALGTDGTWVPITAVTHQNLDAHELTLRNGKVIAASIDHRWPVEVPVHTGRYRIEERTTGELIHLMDQGIKPRLLAAPPENRPNSTLPIAPYVIGALLGDGCFVRSRKEVTFTKNHLPTVQRMAEQLPAKTHVIPVRASDPNKANAYRLVGSIIAQLEAIGLLGRRGPDKFIPDMYFGGSDSQRRQLLAGLLDTDGSVRKGVAMYQTGSKRLAHDVGRLIESLGGVATAWCNQHPKYQNGRGQPCWDIKMRFPRDWGNPFLHADKAVRFKPAHTTLNERLTIESIQSIGKRACVDVEVATLDHLFIANGVISHNSVRNLPTGKELDLDDQTPLYVWAMRQAGFDVRGAILSHTRTQRIKTREMADHERFSHDMVYRTDYELETVVQEAVASISSAYHPDQSSPRHPDAQMCKWRCPFLEPCLGGRKAPHLELQILEAQGFVQKERRKQLRLVT